MSDEDEGYSDLHPPPENLIHSSVDRHSASVIQIDNVKALNVVAICAAFCGLCLGVSMWSAYTARDAATEARLAEYEVSKLTTDVASLERQMKEMQ